MMMDDPSPLQPLDWLDVPIRVERPTAEIVDCACGRDHAEMPYDDEVGELVCREHKRHIPCRKCRYRPEQTDD